MADRKRSLFAAGVLVGAALLLGVVIGGLSSRPAQGQPAPAVQPTSPGRYQLDAYAYSMNVGAETFGAYVLDTQTGEVYHVQGAQAPIALGSVAAPPKPKKK